VKVTVQESEKNKHLENPGGDALLNRLGGRGQGLPFFAFADQKGKLIVNTLRAGPSGGGNIGHPFAPEEIDWFLTMLDRAAPGIVPADRTTIERWLRAQKK
jgi:hypothetical protein